MTDTRQLMFANGIRIVVPDSLELITPYVLQEQEDWFEDEIKFLRRILKPGEQAIDIGANYGVYTLSIAGAVGHSGHVWAFEPTTTIAGFLAESIAANRFTQVSLEKSALSNKTGVAYLSLHAHSELNSLTYDADDTDPREEVPLVTLDNCMERFGWRTMDLVKIDAEGEEANILAGGERFLRELSPLILYEVKAGQTIHLELIQAFADRGYASYRLVPGLDLLVPFNPEDTRDVPLLNLFCCKPDRAERLAAQGALVMADALKAMRAQRVDLVQKARKRATYQWRHALCKQPYGDALSDIWCDFRPAPETAAVTEAIALYAISRDTALPVVERFCALELACETLDRICRERPDYLRQSSLARMTAELGLRSRAVQLLQTLLDRILRAKQVDLSEPFLPPTSRFDTLQPGAAPGQWALAATLEAYEQLVHYSSFYTRDTARERLILIRDLGFGSAEMGRRLDLLQRRYG